MSLETKQIKLYENDNQLVNASIDKIVVEIINKRTDHEKAQTFLLTGCSPLAGTTSTSISLAIALANCQKRTLLVDCDVRKSLKYKKLNEETTVGLANYLLDVDGGKIAVDNIAYSTNIENLFYVPCGVYSQNSTRILCSDKMEQFIEKIKNDFDCVIFDLPSLAIVPDAQVLFGKVDGIILISALGETRKKQIKDAKMKLKPFIDKYYGMIVNKIPLDVYRQNVKDYDYYFVDKKGEQNLNGNVAYKQYQKRAKKRSEEREK
uniref:CpsD/CapB family tyrosine-protein kinase n=1 Tax=Acetatifactor sp. TaxID=1872090 RepID=UPI004057237D